MGTVRGGSWLSFREEELLASHRTPMRADLRSNTVGFRVVVVNGARL
jgi:formylglycine-generating enzyme required for sulfatase activity